MNADLAVVVRDDSEAEFAVWRGYSVVASPWDRDTFWIEGPGRNGGREDGGAVEFES